MTPFQFSSDVGTYAERVARNVPALHELHLLTSLLLAEHVPEAGHVLVLGAGGGLELRALAESHKAWQFTGVDPSGPMLDQAHATMGDLADKVRFIEGYVDDAQVGPFDRAVCLLTLHVLPRDERLRTLQQLGRRLRPGAPLVVAHHSFSKDSGQSNRWLRRYARFLTTRGMPADQAERAIEIMKEHLPVISPEQDEPVLREAGFHVDQLFFAAFTFKGWIARRA